jgi:DNA modification methylase
MSVNNMSDYKLLHGDVVEQLKTLDDESIDAIIVDPPYNLAFMGKKWDSKGGPRAFQQWCEEWGRECFRVLRTGGHILSFGGTRTYHRMAAGLEDAGFDIRDCITWLYGTGFPKSLNISKAIDKRGGEDVSWFGDWLKKWRKDNGIAQKEVAKLFPSKTGNLTGCVANWELGFNLPTNEQFNLICSHFGLPFDNIEEAKRKIIKEDIRYRKNDSWESDGKGMLGSGIQDFSITAPSTTPAQRWSGYGTALKPASEPIVVAQKPKEGTYVSNVMKHGVGPFNIDACRITHNDPMIIRKDFDSNTGEIFTRAKGDEAGLSPKGRWPANVILTHDERCVQRGERVVVGNGHIPSKGKGNPFGGVNENPRKERHYKKEIVEDWECVDECPIHMIDNQSGITKSTTRPPTGKALFAPNDANRSVKWNANNVQDTTTRGHNDKGGASRFFYCAKPSQREKNSGCENIEPKEMGRHQSSLEGGKMLTGSGNERSNIKRNFHPTVKPVALLEWLITLVCPSYEAMQRQPVILDCFVGSGTTGMAAQRLNVDFIGIDANEEYLTIAKARIEHERQDG